jgi:hypothetical protein
VQHFNNAFYVINPHENQNIISAQYTMDLMADTISEIINSIPSNGNYNNHRTNNHYQSTVCNINTNDSDNSELLRNYTDIHKIVECQVARTAKIEPVRHCRQYWQRLLQVRWSLLLHMDRKFLTVLVVGAVLLSLFTVTLRKHMEGVTSEE